MNMESTKKLTEQEIYNLGYEAGEKFIEDNYNKTIKNQNIEAEGVIFCKGFTQGVIDKFNFMRNLETEVKQYVNENSSEEELQNIDSKTR